MGLDGLKKDAEGCIPPACVPLVGERIVGEVMLRTSLRTLDMVDAVRGSPGLSALFKVSCVRMLKVTEWRTEESVGDWGNGC